MSALAPRQPTLWKPRRRIGTRAAYPVLADGCDLTVRSSDYAGKSTVKAIFALDTDDSGPPPNLWLKIVLAALLIVLALLGVDPGVIPLSV